MYALDFEYDGQYLSDYGFVICNFGDQSDMDTITTGSRITFNKVKRRNGKIQSLTSAQYDECIESEFEICKNPDVYDDLRITSDEYRDLMRWLNRTEFLKFQLLTDDMEQETCFFDVSFNIDKIVVSKVLYGLHLNMETNRPFGYGQELTTTLTVADTTKTYSMSDMSDEVGYIYPDLKITINRDGNLKIYNAMEDCNTVINNCKTGEVITIDGDTQIIESSLNSHKIYNDFNFDFFRIGNTINNRNNKITVSLPCKIEISYCPIIKEVPD